MSAPMPAMPSFDDFVRAARFAGDAAWPGPYPWQSEFARRWAAGPTPLPEWIVAPTGSGKTTALDALVWAIAAQADRPVAERTASTRMVWAIDRRILVDEVHERSVALSERLEASLDDARDPLRPVALRLLALAAPGEDPLALAREARAERGLTPLAVTRWRGGIGSTWELVAPWQPQVIVSTVGQVGSRLLFRGYGVGAGRRTVEAALAACDTTLCLDEAHLASPFQETVNAIRGRRELERELIDIPPLRLLTLTATPPQEVPDDRAIRVGTSDHARLGRRWDGSKRVSLRGPDGGAAANQLADTVEALLEEVSGDDSPSDRPPVIACVANRVLTARVAFDLLLKRLDDRATVLLLVGPQRPADRNRQLSDEVRSVLFDGAPPEQPLIVVATQTIEVGLDMDFDAMVTQSASASALVQRIGRLNRSGERIGQGVVVRDEGSQLYGEEEETAWQWLNSLPGAPDDIDVSVRALADSAPPAPTRQAFPATLTDAALLQLAQTSPTPAPYAEPDVSGFLASPSEQPARDVGLVWRCDLRFTRDDDRQGYLADLLELAPPLPDEILTLSLTAARALVAARVQDDKPGKAIENDTDIEGGSRPDETPPRLPAGGDTPFLVKRGGDVLHGVAEDGNEARGTVTLSQIKPGDVIVLPTWLGGTDAHSISHNAWTSLDVGRGMPHSTAGEPAPIRLSLEALLERATQLLPAKRKRGKNEPELSEAELLGVRNEWRRLARRLRQVIAQQQKPSVEAVAEKFAGKPTDPRVPDGLFGHLRLPTVGPSDTPEWCWSLRTVGGGSTIDRDAVDDEASDGSGDDRASAAEDESAPSVDADANADADADTDKDDPHDALAWVLIPMRREDRAAPSSEQPASLEAHCTAVREQTRRNIAPLKLPGSQQRALELAALAHDVGKADPRFQDFLAGGVRSIGAPLLAKSTFGTRDPRSARTARKQSGLPSGFRHEAASVTILHSALGANNVPADLADCDADLALWVAGNHHGRANPTWPIQRVGGTPAQLFSVEMHGLHGEARGDNGDGWLDGTWLQLAGEILERYGPWTLAFMQTMVTVADWTVSREGK